MKILTLKLSELWAEEKDLIPSYPERNELEQFIRNFPGLPLAVIDQNFNIIFRVVGMPAAGSKQKSGPYSGNRESKVLQVNLEKKEALYLAYNLKERLTSINTYEKLLFVKRIFSLADKPEIYSRTRLDIVMTGELIRNLDLLTGKMFREALAQKTFCEKVALGICRFKDESDQKWLIHFFSTINFSRSRSFSILDMLEEISFREKKPLKQIFHGMHQLEEPVTPPAAQAIYQSIFQVRYPKYSSQKILWEKQMKDLNLPANIQVEHAPFFEKNQLNLKITLSGYQELRDFLTKLR